MSGRTAAHRRLFTAVQGPDDGYELPGDHRWEQGAHGAALVAVEVVEQEGHDHVGFDRTGLRLGEVGAPDRIAGFQLSPDDAWIAFQRIDSSVRPRAPDIWVLNLARDAPSRLTVNPANDEDPVWAPDSARLAYAQHRAIRARRVVTGNDEALFESDDSKHPTDWSRDGRFILFERADQSGRAHTWVLPLAGREPHALFEGPHNQRQARFSPDSRSIAYVSDESGRWEVYLQSFPEPGTKRQVSRGGGAVPRWRHDGREVFFMSPDEKVMVASVQPNGTLQVGTPHVLFDLERVVADPFTECGYAVARGGQRFLVAAAVPEEGGGAPAGSPRRDRLSRGRRDPRSTGRPSAGRPCLGQSPWLLFQKVVTDCLGDFSRGRSFDPEVIEPGKLLRLGVRECRRKPLHRQIDRSAVAPPAVHEQDAGRYFPVVFIGAVQPGDFPPFAQVLAKKPQHLPRLGEADEMQPHQELHDPVRELAQRRRRVGEGELDQGIEVPLLGELPLVARYPAHRHGPINRHAGLVHGYFGECRVVAGNFQGHQPSVAVADEQRRASLGSQGEYILTLLDDAVIITLRAALTSSAALDGVDGKVFGQGACEGGIVGSHGEDAGNDQNRWPGAHGEITNRCPILGDHCSSHACEGVRVMLGHDSSLQ